MYRIGLTGGIASGKSTVSAMLAELGATIIDTDEIARGIVRPQQPAWHDIVSHFGTGILLLDGSINRSVLGEKIFKDKKERQCLEKITHPYIEKEVYALSKQAEIQGKSVIVFDVPLLFESGWQKKVDSIWVVYVEEKIQRERLMVRNQLNQEQATDRMNAQMSLAEKVKLADIIIDNNSDIEYTRRQVMMAWEELWRSKNFM